MVDHPYRTALLLAIALAAAGLMFSTGKPVPADGPDRLVALDVGVDGDVYLAMGADVATAGGIARTGDDCVEIARWQTGPVADLALAEGFGALEVWALGDARVARYSVAGAALVYAEAGGALGAAKGCSTTGSTARPSVPRPSTARPPSMTTARSTSATTSSFQTTFSRSGPAAASSG
jgi:hypothetical protein